MSRSTLRSCQKCSFHVESMPSMRLWQIYEHLPTAVQGVLTRLGGSLQIISVIIWCSMALCYRLVWHTGGAKSKSLKVCRRILNCPTAVTDSSASEKQMLRMLRSVAGKMSSLHPNPKLNPSRAHLRYEPWANDTARAAYFGSKGREVYVDDFFMFAYYHSPYTTQEGAIRSLL